MSQQATTGTAPPEPGWWPGPLLGFDTETTGVDVAHDRIVTAALVRRDATGTHVRTWLIDPGVEIPAAALAVHGVTTERARAQGATPVVALDEIAGLLVEAAQAGVPVVAFNAAFDLGILDAELARHGLPTLPERLGHPLRPVLDPMVLDRSQDVARPGQRTLGDLLAVYHVARPGDLHTAEVDVVATLDLLQAILARHPGLTALSHDAVHDRQADWQRGWNDAFATTRARRAADRDAAFLRAVDVAAVLLRDAAVERRWQQPSVLERLSVGALACHLGAQVSVAVELLTGDDDATLPLLRSADEHYARAPWVTATSLDDPSHDRTEEDADARAGRDALLDRVRTALTAVHEALGSGAPAVVPVPWQGWRLRRADFLLTRMVEIVVHCDDLAVSLGLAAPTFDDSVFEPVSRLLLRLATRRHGQSTVVGALARRERTPPTISAF